MVLKATERLANKAKKDDTVDVPKNPPMPLLLEWFDLRELETVIVSKSCWQRFEEMLRNKETFQRKFGQLADLRNTLAHNRTLDDVTRDEGRAAVVWFETLLAA